MTGSRGSYDVIVVGGGPAALGACAALRTFHGSVLIVSSPQVVQPHPVFLSERACTELDSIQCGRPIGHTVENSIIRTTDMSASVELAVRSLLVDGHEWQRFLHRSLKQCGHECVEGTAQLLDAADGIIEIVAPGKAANVRAKCVVWAAGVHPDNSWSTPGTRLFIRVAKLSSKKPDDNLTFVVPSLSRRSGNERSLVAGWKMQIDKDHAIIGVVSDHDVAEADVYWPPHGYRQAGSVSAPEMSRGTADWGFWPNGSVRGRILLAGAAAGLVNPMTMEGFSYAIASGRIAGRAAQRSPDFARRYVAMIGSRFGVHPRPDQHAVRRLRFATRVIDGAVRGHSPARDRIIALLVDHGVGISSDEVHPRGPVAPWPQAMTRTRSAIQKATIHEVRDLWRSPAPSFTEIPRLPDIRLSDLLVACTAPKTQASEELIRAGAAIDLTLASMGFLAMSVSDSDRLEDKGPRRRNWPEIGGVVSHDVLAASALHLAMQASERVGQAFLLWLEATAITRQSAVMGGPSTPLELFEAVFEFPCRLGGILSDDTPEATAALCGLGRSLGAAYALGEELSYVHGRLGRLGLTGPHARSLGLRPVWAVDEDPSANVALRSATDTRLDAYNAIRDVRRLDVQVTVVLKTILETCLDTQSFRLASGRLKIGELDA